VADDRPRLLRSAQEIVEHIQDTQSVKLNNRPLEVNTLEQAAFRLAQSYDWQNGVGEMHRNFHNPWQSNSCCYAPRIAIVWR